MSNVVYNFIIFSQRKWIDRVNRIKAGGTYSPHKKISSDPFEEESEGIFNALKRPRDDLNVRPIA